MSGGKSKKKGTLTTYFYSVDSDHYWYIPNNPETGYGGTAGTGYANITLARGAGAETYFYYKFDTSMLPANAEIVSVSIEVKASITTTSSNTVTSRYIVATSGTTQKGSTTTIDSSGSIYTLSSGTWTREELNDVRVFFNAIRGSSNANTSYAFRIYGANLQINYLLEEGTPPTNYLLWQDMTHPSNTRSSKYIDVIIETGDIVSIKLNDYTTWQYSIVVLTQGAWGKGSVVTDTGFLSEDRTKTISSTENGHFLRITIKKADNSNFTAEEAEAALEKAIAIRPPKF